METARRILTIEDDAAIRRGIVDALRFAGHEPHEAPRGDDGLALALDGSFDLVLLDLVLPGAMGWRFCDRCGSPIPRCR